jgi:hypothetical protein
MLQDLLLEAYGLRNTKMVFGTQLPIAPTL